MFNTTYQAKYVTKTTAQKYGLFEAIAKESESVVDFGYILKERSKWVEIIDPETNKIMDYGHFILLTNENGDKFANILYSERESLLVVGEGKEDWSSTLFVDLDIKGFPPY